MEWLQKKRQAVIRRWKADEVGLAEAARELTALGVPPLRAWDLLQSV